MFTPTPKNTLFQLKSPCKPLLNNLIFCYLSIKKTINFLSAAGILFVSFTSIVEGNNPTDLKQKLSRALGMTLTQGNQLSFTGDSFTAHPENSL